MAWDTIATTDSPLTGNPDPNIKLTHVWSGVGGCAANICYSLSTSEHHIRCVAPVGLDNLTGVSSDDLLRLPATIEKAVLPVAGPPSRAFVMTDPEGNQRTYFAPGRNPTLSTWQTHLNELPNPDWVIQAPLQPELMLAGINWAKRRNALTLWSPGQYCSALSAAQLKQGLEKSDFVLCNAGEAKTITALSSAPRTLCQIITNGAGSILVKQGDQVFEMEVPIANVVDPTGCGDAFIAGLVTTLAASTQPRELQILKPAIEHGIHYAQACLTEIGCQNHLESIHQESS